MKERIQKILSSAGVASRRTAERLLADGRICVNGSIASVGERADPDVDEILIDGKPLPKAGEKIYLMLHKPRGYVTTLLDEKGRRNVAQLVENCGVRVYPVGRLDMDSEGLLIMTNDGAFANALMHPRQEVEKTYEVWIVGYRDEIPAKLAKPITLDGYQIQPPKIKLLWSNEEKAKLLITIHEGRNRQIRRMCEAAGAKVTRLRRISEGNLQLGDLPLGTWRYLTEEELAGQK